MLNKFLHYFVLLLLLLPFFASAASCPTLTRTLSIGSRGTEVTQLQQFLISQNLLSADSASGYFGRLTQSAVKQFQCRQGIVCGGSAATTGYGVVGKKTRLAIQKSCDVVSVIPTPNPSPSPSPSPTPTPTPTPLTYSWQTGGWGVCTNSSQSRTVSCVSSNSATVTDEYCTTTKPNLSQSCDSTVTNQSCMFNTQIVAHGASVSAYQSASVPFGQTCASQSRTCTNGALSGTYAYASCTAGTATSCTFNGQTIAHGSSVTAYQSSSVSAGSSCVSETRSCSNGTLSGSYTNASCSVSTIDMATLYSYAISDLVKNFWTGSILVGHITPTWDGIVGNPLHDSRGGLWQAETMLNVLYAGYLKNPASDESTRIKAEWNYIQSNFSATDFSTCGASSPQLFGVDDIGWDASMLLKIYDITGDERALSFAKMAVKCGVDRWGDSQLGGGLWYDDRRDVFQEKSLIQIGLVLDAYRIFEITNDPTYYQYAVPLYDWNELKLLRSDGLYWMDHYVSGPPTDRPNDIYKVGRTAAGSVTSIAGNMGMGIMHARMYRLTGEEMYKQRAIRSAEAILNKLVDQDGVFIDDRDPWADGHFVREWMLEVLPLSSSLQSRGEAAIRTTANAVYTKDRTSDGYYGGDWGGPVGATSPWSQVGFTPPQIMTSSNAIDFIAAGMLLSGSSVSASRERDTKRKASLQQLRYALAKYKTAQGSYPTTGGEWYSSEQGDYGAYNNGNYIPGLSPSFITALPRDPQGGAGKYTQCAGWKSAYIYRSDGTSYKLISHCAPESTVPSTNMFYDAARPTWAWMVCSGTTACAQW